MIIKRVFLSFLICALVALFSLNALAATEENPLAKFSKILPEKVGAFKAKGKIKPIAFEGLFEGKSNPKIDYVVIGGASRDYISEDGTIININLLQSETESGAYSYFTNSASPSLSLRDAKDEVGVESVRKENGIHFFKGTYLVSITTESKEKIESAISFAKEFAQSLGGGENDIPLLVKHLPDWEKAKNQAVYIINLNKLKTIIESQSVLDIIPIDSGIEAVIARYDKSKLVIVEYNTPQIATDADQRITQKINELKSQNQPVPSAYKRVGNYSVFVFDAPDEAAANNLINQVDYGKTVQWLYGDPFENERANRRYLNTAGGIIITVLKTAGIALALCLIIGGGFGYYVFMRRRKQAAMSTAFSDAGGMLRLNLDEMTPQRDPARLLEKANK